MSSAIPKFPFTLGGGKGKKEGGILGNTLLGNTMIAASNTLRKNLARVANTRSSKKQISNPKVKLGHRNCVE